MKSLLLTFLFIFLLGSYYADCNVTRNYFSNITCCVNTNQLVTNFCLIEEKALIAKPAKNKISPFDSWEGKMMIW